jgi:hypothetical protein
MKQGLRSLVYSGAVAAVAALFLIWPAHALSFEPPQIAWPAPGSTVVSTSSSASSYAMNYNVSTVNGVTTGTMDVTTSDNDPEHPCLAWQNHEFEVCVAYYMNSSYGARLPFYEAGTNPSPAWARLATYRLESRYAGQARALLENQIAAWPRGDVQVGLPHISIKSVNASLTNNTAILETVESWSVKTLDGQPLFIEDSQPHVIMMQQVPGLFLRKWVVSQIH